MYLKIKSFWVGKHSLHYFEKMLMHIAINNLPLIPKIRGHFEESFKEGHKWTIKFKIAMQDNLFCNGRGGGEV